MVIRVNCNRHKIWPLEKCNFEITLLHHVGIDYFKNTVEFQLKF